LLVVDTLPAIVAAVVVVGLGGGWGGALQSRFTACFDGDERGAGLGVVRLAYVLLGATGSVTTGTLADTVGWPAAVGAIVAVATVAVVTGLANHALGWNL
jgi:hypothetical protein